MRRKRPSLSDDRSSYDPVDFDLIKAERRARAGELSLRRKLPRRPSPAVPIDPTNTPPRLEITPMV
jgi:hypothetical protein